MATPTPAITVDGAVGVLTTLGVLPVIVLGALVFVAGLLFKRFRR